MALPGSPDNAMYQFPHFRYSLLFCSAGVKLGQEPYHQFVSLRLRRCDGWHLHGSGADRRQADRRFFPDLSRTEKDSGYVDISDVVISDMSFCCPKPLCPLQEVRFRDWISLAIQYITHALASTLSSPLARA